MTTHEMMNKIDAVLRETKAAVLTTVDAAGNPHARWMTPAVVAEMPGVLLAVTGPDFKKILQLDNNNRVEWLIQTKALDQIINVRGGINIIDNPSMKAQIMESVGRHLNIFWRVNPDTSEFVVLETVIEEAAWYQPMKNRREIVTFKAGEQ